MRYMHFNFYFWCLLEVALNEYAEEEGTMVDKDTTTESPGSTSVTLTESTSVPMGESSVIVFVVGVVLNDGELPNKIQHYDHVIHSVCSKSLF